jgi:hypothetical protein
VARVATPTKPGYDRPSEERMSEPKAKFDIVLVVLLMGVAIAGFWMTGYAMNAQMEVLEQKIEVVQVQTKATMRTVAELHDTLRQLKKAQAGESATAAPAPTVAPVAKK